MPCMKRFTETKRRRSTGQQPGTKSASRPAVKPRFNRGFRSSIALHRISLVGASWEMRRCVFDAFGGTREVCFLGEEFCWHPVLPDPAPPLRRALRPDAPVVCSAFGFDKLFVSGLSVDERAHLVFRVPVRLFYARRINEQYVAFRVVSQLHAPKKSF